MKKAHLRVRFLAVERLRRYPVDLFQFAICWPT
jgi:hypothetical protein